MTDIPQTLAVVEIVARDLHRVAWRDAERIAGVAVEGARRTSDAAAFVSATVRWALRKPQTTGPLAQGIAWWDAASPAMRQRTILAAWRQANPSWAHKCDHDPKPGQAP